MKRIHGLVLVVAALAAIIVAANEYGAINFDGLKSVNAGALLLGALFTALLIERAVEVVANNRFAVKEFKATQSINTARQAVTIAEGALKHEAELRLADASSPSAAPLVTQKAGVMVDLRENLKDARTELNRTKSNARPEIEVIRHQKQTFAATFATVLGALAAIAGVRILGQFVEGEIVEQFAVGSFQLNLFFFADIVLTALLLAGGADGIHELTKDFYGKRKDVLAPQNA